MGRSKKYNDNFPLLGEDYARKGMIDKEIYKNLGISKDTYYKYLREYPDFSDSIKRGKAPIDVEAENLLLQRMRGFEYEETIVEYKPLPAIKVSGKNQSSDVETEDDPTPRPSLIRKVTKMVIPDTTAIIFWLKNRRPKEWKDKHNMNLTGSLDIKVLTAIPRPGELKDA